MGLQLVDFCNLPRAALFSKRMAQKDSSPNKNFIPVKVQRLEFSTRIDAEIDQVWAFFARAANLARLTPPEMALKDRFEALADEVYPGMIIVHEVKPLPFYTTSWVTEILTVEPPHRFVDVQRSGPFAIWHHEHRLSQLPAGTEVKDILHYALPFGPLGSLAHALFVKRQLLNTFEFREKKLREIFA